MCAPCTSSIGRIEGAGSMPASTRGIHGPAAGVAVDREVKGPQLHQVRRETVRTLREIGPAAVPTLLLALEDPEPTVRRAAAFALGVVSQSFAPVATAFESALSDEDPVVRWEVVGALMRIGDRQAVSLLLRASRDTSPRVREAAVGALGRVGAPTPEVVQALIGALGDPEGRVAPIAVSSLPRD